MALSSIIIAPAAGGVGGGGVTSLKAFGQPDITGAAVLKAGTSVSLGQSGQEITVNATVPAAGGAPPAVAAAGAAGSGTAYSLSNHTHAGVTSVNGLQGAVTGTFAPTPAGAGDADKVVAANGTGAALALTSTPWLAGARVGMGGSASGTAFGTAPLQVQGDATNGQGLGLRAEPVSDRVSATFFDDAGAAKGDVELDAANVRVTLRGRAAAVHISTSADDSKKPMQFDANSNNVWIGSNATPDHNGGEGIVTLAAASALPTALAATDGHLLNSAGTVVARAGTGFHADVGVTTRLKVVAGVVAVNTNFSLGALAPTFSGANVAYFVNATVPTANPSGGAFFYGDAGGLKARGSGGTITTVAAA